MSNTVTIGKREWVLTAKGGLENLKADLVTRGFTPFVYMGVSKPVGRQRREMTALVYQCATTGKFVI